MFNYNETWTQAINEELQSIADQAKEEKIEKQDSTYSWQRFRKVIGFLKKKQKSYLIDKK